MRRLLVALSLTACLPAEVTQVVTIPLSDGFTFVRGGGGNSVVLVSGERALVFDPKMWPYENSVLEVLRGARLNATWVVNSHLHGDHAGANRYHRGALIVAAPDTARVLASESVGAQHPRRSGAPSFVVRGELRLLVGREPVVLVHPGPAHTSGDVYAWFPQRRTLVTGDLFDNGFYPHVDARHGGRFDGYLEVLEKLCTYDVDVVIPGHGAAATRADLLAYRDFLRKLRDDVERDRSQGINGNVLVARLTPRGSEPYLDLGPFSSRAGVVRGLLAIGLGK